MQSLHSPSTLMPQQSGKIFYIDRIKVILTILVVLHHTFITYGAPGGWYFSQKTSLMGALIPMTLFVSINQSFFMGFFFFLSAYFIGPSFARKGASRFLADRLLRLGVPLVFYSLLLSPLLTYIVYYFAEANHISYTQFLHGFHPWIDFGVLWFVAALLIFTIIYVLCRTVFKTARIPKLGTPTFVSIVSFALTIGFISFLVRIWFPVGVVIKPLGFQPGHFSQYVALFILGLIASKNKWLDSISFKTGKKFGMLILILLLVFPCFYIIMQKSNLGPDLYAGGFHWQPLLYAVWEQLMGFSLITVLLCYGKKLWNSSSALVSRLSRYTFAVYIFHPLILISLSVALRNWPVDPAVKLLVVAPLAVVGSFLLASLIVMIPGVKKII
jgi:Acyltransferase family